MNVASLVPLIATIAYIALFVVLRYNRPWGIKHRLFVLFLIPAVLWSFTTFLFRSIDILSNQYEWLGVRIAICLLLWMLVQLHYLIRSFYKSERMEIPWDYWAYLFPIAIIAMAAAGVPDFGSRPPDGDPYGYWIIPPFALFLATAGREDIRSLVQKRRHPSCPAERNQLGYLLLAIAVLTVSILSYIPQLITGGPGFPVGHIGNFLVGCIFTYAVVKPRLADIRVVFRQAGVYVVRYGIGLIIGFGVVIGALSQQPDPGILTRELTAILATTFFLLVPFTLFLVHWVRDLRRRKRARYSYRDQLSHFINRIHDVASLQELGSEFTKLIARSIECKRAGLLLPQTEKGGFGTRFIYPRGEDNPMGELRLRLDSPIISWLEREGTILRKRSVTILPEFGSMWAEELEEIRSAEVEMFVPLTSKKKLIAILAVSERRDGKLYWVDDEYHLESVSARVAASMAKEYSREQLEEQSRIDELTGLFNRRHFGERLDEEVSRHSRDRGSFSVLMLDLDNFKAYNDRYGHPAGNILLGRMGEIIKGSVRSIDHAFRYGGDEFAVILPRIAREDAYMVAERVRVGIAKRMEEQAIAVTVSIGLASCPADGVVADELVDVADDALYDAKRAGGNRICPSSSISSEPSDEGGMHGT
jgi:diguanylate cyclase (GGDEF)-like protein